MQKTTLSFSLHKIIRQFYHLHRYASSPVLLERSEAVRVKLGDVNTQFFLAALFSSVSIFLPASHVFSKSVLKVIFGGGGDTFFLLNILFEGMVGFLQLTMLQLGGEKELLKKTDLKVVCRNPKPSNYILCQLGEPGLDTTLLYCRFLLDQAGPHPHHLHYGPQV